MSYESHRSHISSEEVLTLTPAHLVGARSPDSPLLCLYSKAESVWIPILLLSEILPYG